MSQTEGVVPQHVLHGALGTLLIGTWINTTLFAFEVLQIYHYFASSPLCRLRSGSRADVTAIGRRSDPTWIRFLVLWMFALDFSSSSVGCAMVYNVCMPYLERMRASDATFALVHSHGLGQYCYAAEHRLVRGHRPMRTLPYVTTGFRMTAFFGVRSARPSFSLIPSLTISPSRLQARSALSPCICFSSPAIIRLAGKPVLAPSSAYSRSQRVGFTSLLPCHSSPCSVIWKIDQNYRLH